MHFHFSIVVLAVLLRIGLCDTVYYESISISTAYLFSTDRTATDHSTTPNYYTYPSNSTSKSTFPEQTTCILRTSGPPITTQPTTYTYPKTTISSSSSSTCVSPTFTWTEPTTVPTDIPSYGNYRMERRADPPKLTPEQVRSLKKLIRIYDAIEKAKPVIDKAIEDGLTECQDFKDLVAILKVFAPIFDGLQEWLDERHL